MRLTARRKRKARNRGMFIANHIFFRHMCVDSTPDNLRKHVDVVKAQLRHHEMTGDIEDRCPGVDYYTGDMDYNLEYIADRFGCAMRLKYMVGLVETGRV